VGGSSSTRAVVAIFVPFSGKGGRCKEGNGGGDLAYYYGGHLTLVPGGGKKNVRGNIPFERWEKRKYLTRVGIRMNSNGILPKIDRGVNRNLKIITTVAGREGMSNIRKQK